MSRIHRKRFDIGEELRKTDRARKKSLIMMAINIAIVMVLVFVMTPVSAKSTGIRLAFSSILFAGGIIVILFFLIRWLLRRKKK